MTANFDTPPESLQVFLEETKNNILSSESASKGKVFLSHVKRFFAPEVEKWFTTQVSKHDLKKSPVRKFVEEVLHFQCESKPHCYIVVDNFDKETQTLEKLDQENTELAMTIIDLENTNEMLRLEAGNTELLVTSLYEKISKLETEVKAHQLLMEKLRVTAV